MPELYAAVARDRDFAAQVTALESLTARQPDASPRLLELFAGPAYHAVEAVRRGWRAHAVDSSPGMRDMAVRSGFPQPDHYLVGLLPETLSRLDRATRFDCVLAARYSLGYLERAEVNALLRGLRPHLADHGAVVLELHDVRLVTSGLADLGIQARVTRMSDGSLVRCYWPDGPLTWEADDHVATMSVRVESEHPEGRCGRSRFTSREHVYSAAEIAYLASLAGYRPRTLPSALREEIESAFPGAVLVVLEKRYDADV